MAVDPSMQGIEAQKLISISLGKMAASRIGKCGSSLHKSLLVASVLQRARHVFLEENYHNYHYRGPATISPVPMYAPHVPPPLCSSCETPGLNDENRCSTLQPDVLTITAQEPECGLPRMPLADASNQQQRVVALKRRRCVSDKETQDAVSSILPKRFRISSENTSPNCGAAAAAATIDNEASTAHVCANGEPVVPASPASNVLVPIPMAENALTPLCLSGGRAVGINESAVLEGVRDPTMSNPIYCTLEPISDDEDEEDDDEDVNSMEVDHITSLVSIFSFGAPRKDMCATQAAREDHAQFTPVALAV